MNNPEAYREVQRRLLFVISNQDLNVDEIRAKAISMIEDYDDTLSVSEMGLLVLLVNECIRRFRY